jgi:hypothetical protein
MVLLREKIIELCKNLEIAKEIQRYKTAYLECRPECLHLFFNSYSINPKFLETFENYIENPTKYDITKIENELKLARFTYFVNLQASVFESNDPTEYT